MFAAAFFLDLCSYFPQCGHSVAISKKVPLTAHLCRRKAPARTEATNSRETAGLIQIIILFLVRLLRHQLVGEAARLSRLPGLSWRSHLPPA
jgi:hypothetical protein